MAIDTSVAAKLTVLKTKWNSLTTGNDLIKGVEDILMYMPVDKTSVVPVKIPGRIARFLGFTKDETPSGFGIWTPPEKDYSRKDANRATTPIGTAKRSGKSTGFYRVWVNLKTPIPFTRKTKTVNLTSVGMRVPYIVPIAGVMCFLWNHSDAAKRPLSFETVNSVYYLKAITYTDASLGEKGAKSEKEPESDTASEGVGQPNNTSKK